MTEKPYVPFYKPYGMSDEEYEYEVHQAKRRLAEWQEQQDELDQIEESGLTNDEYNEETRQETLNTISENCTCGAYKLVGNNYVKIADRICGINI